MQNLSARLPLSPGVKLFLLATLPLIVAIAAIAPLVASQSRALAEREIAALERQLIEAKKAELRNYVTQARNGFNWIYGNAGPDDEAAKEKVLQILAAMTYGDEGFFFVYDYEGMNLVSPRQTDMINRNWWDLEDAAGRKVVQEFIATAREGTGWVTHLWPKPSTGEEAQMATFVTALHSWKWAIGTGVFIDDVLATVAAARAEVQARVRQTFLVMGGVTLAALVLVFAGGWLINVRERRRAAAKVKGLTQRVFDAQEEERIRVARELHDGISQLLVGVRFALDTARRRLASGDARAAETLDRGMESLGTAIQEVRRISRDLRPGVLDDLGLGPAIKQLAEELGARSDITVNFSTVPFRNRLDEVAKTALYRVAQEALMNVERHSGARNVTIEVRGTRRGAMLRIADDGCGLPQPRRGERQGLGLRNMQERIEQLDGTLRILSSPAGTMIEAIVPLTHMLTPDRTGTDEIRKAKA